MGGGRPGGRCFSTSARFSPACLHPVKNSAIRRSWKIHTTPLVNTPVRSGEMSASRSSDSTRIDVSSLCTTSPCAAWRVSSCSAGWRLTAVSATISHSVATGNGMPRLLSRPCNRYHGTQLPYRSRAIMLAAVSSYFFSPTPSGAAAVYTSPHRLHRNFFQLIHGRGDERLPLDPHQHTGLALRIYFA